jgi:dienelactone hydrolase
MTPLATATLIFVSLLQAPSPPQQPASDVVVQAQAALAAILAGDFAKVEEQFTGEMTSVLPPGRLAATWTTLRSQAGAYKSCGTTPRVVRIEDRQMVITPCEFERAAIDIQFAFDSAGRISGLSFRPAASAPAPYTLPPYATPAAYVETEATIGSGEWALPATLTMPAGTGSVPAVVLVHGSGPLDRDESVGANKPFKDLAVGLASRGIAVLRYDKRTNVHGAKLAAVTNFTVHQEVIENLLEAVEVLRAHPRIDAARVFVLGHSLGGMLVPRIGTADPTIAGLIVLAGAARPLEEAIVAQTRYLAAADGTISPEDQKAIDQAAALAEGVRALTAEDATSGQMISGAPASYWMDLRGYDPPSTARQVKAPMLILQGERDYQVTPEEFAEWKAALGSRRDVTFHSYATLNHLFIAGTGPSLPVEYLVPGHVAEDVIRDIAAWVLGQR